MTDLSANPRVAAPTVASLLDLDPAIARSIAPDEQDDARRAFRVRVLVARPATEALLEEAVDGEAVVGLSIARGVVLQEHVMYGAGSYELLGPGDVLAPRARDRDTVLPVARRLQVIEPTAAAILDAEFSRAGARWPQVPAIMARRLSAQQDRAASQAAIGRLPRVELRLLAALWHLADLWGRVTPEGTVVPFPLSHEALGRFVGARRPTVTLALGALDREDLARRRPDRAWLLPVGSAEALGVMLEAVPPTPPLVVRARVARDSSRDVLRRAAAARDTSRERGVELQALRAQTEQIMRRRRGVPSD